MHSQQFCSRGGGSLVKIEQIELEMSVKYRNLVGIFEKIKGEHTFFFARSPDAPRTEEIE